MKTVRELSLYYLYNFSVNLKLFQNKKAFFFFFKLEEKQPKKSTAKHPNILIKVFIELPPVILSN